MRLVLRMFQALVLVMSRGLPIASPTFVEGAVDGNVLGTSTLEACVSREGSGPSFRRSWGTVHDDRVTS